MLEILRDLLQRLQQVPQHREIYFHLLAFEPAFQQIRLLVYRRINDVRYVGHLRRSRRIAAHRAGRSK
jgi:hypothetical protein